MKKRRTLLDRIKQINGLYLKHDPETAHAKIDVLLVEYIDIKELKNEVNKCYRAINALKRVENE